SNDGFGVVKSFSPANNELAPAIKQSACSTVVISVRPADKRTTVLGIIIRVVAIMRTISHTETLGWSANGVPLIGTKALIGTDSGCFGKFESVFSIEIRSSTVSPKPIIPP